MQHKPNPYWSSLQEWTVRVHKRWWNMLNVVLTAIPLGVAIVGYFVWAFGTKANPLPIWNLILLVAGVIIFGLSSFLAFHRVKTERDEAKAKCEELTLGKQSAKLIISYHDDQNWGFPNPNIPNIDTERMVKIGIDYNPSRLMQIAKIFIKIDNAEPGYEAWSQNQFDIDKPEHHESWFHLPHVPAGIHKAKLVILANNKLWESNEFDLNIPPKSLANSPSTSHKEGPQK